MSERTIGELADELEPVLKGLASKYYARGLFEEILACLRSMPEGERTNVWLTSDEYADLGDDKIGCALIHRLEDGDDPEDDLGATLILQHREGKSDG